MKRSKGIPQAASDLAAAFAGLAEELRQSFCSLLADEIDLLAGSVIELNALCRESSDPGTITRLSDVSDTLDGLRAEKAHLASRLGCIALPSGSA
jgi:hypothetical protein